VQGSDWGNRQEIEAEAARILARLQSEPSDTERADLYLWIDAHPAHAVAFAQAELAWEQSERLKASTQTFDLSDDHQAEAGSRWPKPRQRSFLIGGALAASLLLAGAGMTTKLTNGFTQANESGHTCSEKK